MTLKRYQLSEVIGILFVLAATATQIFYLEPLKRGIEWRMAAYHQQQNGQVLARSVYDNGIAILKAVNAGDAQIEAAAAAKKDLVQRYRTADANVAEVILDKEGVEGILQGIVLALFCLGSLLTTVGRIAEMRFQNGP